MGLDNGIVIKANKEIKAPFWIHLEYFDSMQHNHAEICYWRKCWGIRNLIIDKLIDDKEDSGEYELSITDVNNIRRVLAYFNSAKKWERDSDSIWEWKEIRFTLLRQRVRLLWLTRYMKKNNVKVYFYDSY